MKIFNRQARRKYNILETFEAGVVLTGYEVKSVRENRVDISEAFAKIQNGEAYLKNMQVFPPQAGFPHDYNPLQDRKLLLHKAQINNLIGKLSRGGMNLVPLSLYTVRNYIKVELALGSPKTKYDKRKAIKARDENLRLEQEIRGIK